MNFFILRTRSIWNGLGNVLVTGITDSISVYETMCLSRTGPFVPNICEVPIGRLVMNEQFKQLLERSNFSKLEFREVVLEKIVALDWHLWDMSASYPPYLPKSGNPDDFILKGEHDPELAKQIGVIWECILPDGGVVNATPRKSCLWQFDVKLKLSTWNGLDFFSTGENSGLYVSERGKSWLIQNGAKWLAFEEIQVV